MVVLVVVLCVLGVALVVLGICGVRESLPRNRFVGVRTEDALSCQEAYALANKVAGLPTGAAGVLLILAAVGVAGLDGAEAAVVGAVGAAGALGLLLAGGVQGGRAAQALTTGATTPAGPHARCTDCVGCDLMASLRG